MELQIKIKKKFSKYKKTIIEQVGSKAMYDDEINSICHKLFGSKWAGAYAVDKIPIKKYNYIHYFIVNTDKSNEAGTHWVAVVLHKQNCYIYDSFGRKTENILKPLVGMLNKKSIHFTDSNYTKEQHGDTQICAQLCIAFLLCFDQFGRDALLI
jgi:hypothetical protein